MITKDYTKELIKDTRFNSADIALFFKDNLLSGEFNKDKEVLKILEKVYFSQKHIRRMLSRLSKSQRKHLIKTCEMSKPEAFVYTRLQNNDVRKIYRELISQLKQFYKLDEKQAKKVISKIARRVRLQKYYRRKKTEK